MDDKIDNICPNIIYDMLENIKREFREENDTLKLPFRLLPPFNDLAPLNISRFPFEIPAQIQCFGKYFVIPFTDKQIIGIADMIEEFIAEKFIAEIREPITKLKNQTDINKKIAEFILQGDNPSNCNSHFKKVLQYVSKEMQKSNPALSMKQAEDKCKDFYIDAAVWLIDILNKRFFDDVKILCERQK